jgi:L-alanine-DL-glutamate epimerase-like enolase superfamily enzyme
MALKLARHTFHPLRIPYARPIRWAGHAETGLDVLLLVLETKDGLKGVGETPVRLNWHAATLKSLMVVIDEVFLPQMQDLDLGDAAAVRSFLGGCKEHPLAKSLIDTAACDLRARAAGMPLWQQLGTSDAKVPISWTVTRAAPQDMAREAVNVSDKYGVHAFKIKTGQGFATDAQVMQEIRRAVGDNAALFADSNGAHRPAEVPTMSELLADHGVSLFEDPCPLVPNDEFRAIRKSSRLPILVDNACRSLGEAKLFLDVGAEALSVKVMKTGITESLLVADLASKQQARVAVGISATTSLGALNALTLSASLPPESRCAPCEETFFATIPDILHEPLSIKDGSVTLPMVGGYEPLIDWQRVASLRVA